MTRLALPAAALLLLGVLAGCSQPPGEAAGPVLHHESSAVLAQRLASRAPNVTVDADGAVAWWQQWVNDNPERLPTTPKNVAARDQIADALRAAGLSVQIRQYAVGALGVIAPDVPVAHLSAVVATKDGTTNPDHVIALISHYDTQPGTLYGAYDNGAGTAADLATCKALAGISMNRTLQCIFFDGEEEGTVTSQQFAAQAAAQTALHYDFVLGFDMTGLNWPGYTQWKMYEWVGSEYAESLFPVVNATLHDVLAFPDSGAEAFPFNDRNSDEASFADIHVPTIRFAGGRTAGAYPQYHKPQDTVDFVEQFAGGRDHFVQGFGAIVQAATQLVVELDQTSLAALATAAST